MWCFQARTVATLMRNSVCLLLEPSLSHTHEGGAAVATTSASSPSDSSTSRQQQPQQLLGRWDQCRLLLLLARACCPELTAQPSSLDIYVAQGTFQAIGALPTCRPRGLPAAQLLLALCHCTRALVHYYQQMRSAEAAGVVDKLKEHGTTACKGLMAGEFAHDGEQLAAGQAISAALDSWQLTSWHLYEWSPGDGWRLEHGS